MAKISELHSHVFFLWDVEELAFLIKGLKRVRFTETWSVLKKDIWVIKIEWM